MKHNPQEQVGFTFENPWTFHLSEEVTVIATDFDFDAYYQVHDSTLASYAAYVESYPNDFFRPTEQPEIWSSLSSDWIKFAYQVKSRQTDVSDEERHRRFLQKVRRLFEEMNGAKAKLVRQCNHTRRQSSFNLLTSIYNSILLAIYKTRLSNGGFYVNHC